ncbi:MAG: NDP-hexose 2,3-dehydratase family protein, partial [Pseudomonadota bacterium]
MLQTMDLADRNGLQTARAAMRTGFSIREIAMADAAPHWALIDGAVRHSTGGFFAIAGFTDPETGAERLMLNQPQGAVNGLATAIGAEGRRVFLLQSRAEPGNEEEVQFGPSLQSTPANWMRLHGGAPSPYAAAFLEHAAEARTLVETTQLDLGGRYVLKSKRVSISEGPQTQPSEPGFHWTTCEGVLAGLDVDYCFNTDLRAAIGVAPWSADPEAGELAPRSELVRRSLAAPARAEALGAAIAKLSERIPAPLWPTPIEALSNWEVGPQGLDERRPDQNLSVRFYEIEARAREMKSWIQPLIVGRGEGRFLLLCRERGGAAEVFVAVRREPGLPNGAAFAPSFLAYPGEPTTTPEWIEAARPRPWIEVRES